MEALMTKMREYLKMDTEISFIEFKEYYETIMTYLQKEYEDLSNEGLLSAKFILDIVNNNANARALRKVPETKKLKKISDKCSLWSEAISLRLLNNGLSQQEIDDKLDQLGAVE